MRTLARTAAASSVEAPLARAIRATLVAGAAAILAILAAPTPAQAQAQPTPDAIEIGLIAAKTGSQVTEFTFAIRSAELAVEQANAVGGVNGKPISLVIEDNASTPQGTAAAYESLAKRPKIVGIIGVIKTPQALALAAKARLYDIPTMSGSSSSLFTSADNKNLFRIRPTENTHTSALAKFAKKTFGDKKFALFFENDAFGKGSANYFDKHAKDMGLNVIKRMSFPADVKDFKPLIEQLKGADVVVLYSTTWQNVAAFFTQHKEAGSPFIILGNTALSQKQTIAAAKSAAEGIYGIADAVAGQSAANTKFTESYKAKFKDEPEYTQAWTFDAANILIEALKKANSTDRRKIAAAISTIKTHEGMLGTFRFDAHGEGLHEAAIVKVQSGKPVLVERMQGD